MFIKTLSIIVLIHTAASTPQFGLGGLGGGNRRGATQRPSGPGGLGGLGGLGAPGGPITASGSGVGLNLGGILPGIDANVGLSPNGLQVKGHVAGFGLGISLGFGDFKSIFNKSYIDEFEEAFRKKIFEANFKIISNHNELFEKGLQKFSLTVNYFGDWSHEEYLSILGVDLASAEKKSSSKSKKTKRQTKPAESCSSPETKDWRENGAVTSVKSQMKCASCWAFSAAGALEGQFILRNGVNNSLSEQQFIDCSKDLGNNGCNKGFMNNAFEYTQNDGIVTEDEYPYEGKDSSCRAKPNKMKIKGFESIPKGDEEKLKDAVCRVGPISVALDATDEKFKFYHDGVYFNGDCSSEKTTHAVLVIGYGYDDVTELDYWLIKNSYGTTWGKDGFGKVARNEKNHCGIANLASYPLV